MEILYYKKSKPRLCWSGFAIPTLRAEDLKSSSSTNLQLASKSHLVLN